MDKAATAQGVPAPSGSLRQIVRLAVRAREERAKSITLAALFDDYTGKLRRMRKSESYVEQYRWCRGYFASTAFLEEKVSDLTPAEIKAAFAELPGGNFNSNLRLIRAVLDHAVKREYLKKNPALQVEFVARQRADIRPLANDVVRAMFADAATNTPHLLAPWAIGFFTGIREAELFENYSGADVQLDGDHSHVLVRASVSKTRRKRFPPLPSNAVEWLNLDFQLTGTKPEPDELVLSHWTPKMMRLARARNYAAAITQPSPKWPANCKRISFATNWIAAFEDLGQARP